MLRKRLPVEERTRIMVGARETKFEHMEYAKVKTGEQIPWTATIVAAEEQVSTEHEGDTIILSLEDGSYYRTGPVGTTVWEAIQESPTMAAIRDKILAEYDVEPSECESDLQELIRDLAENGLVEIRETSDTP